MWKRVGRVRDGEIGQSRNVQEETRQVGRKSGALIRSGGRGSEQDVCEVQVLRNDDCYVCEIPRSRNTGQQLQSGSSRFVRVLRFPPHDAPTRTRDTVREGKREQPEARDLSRELEKRTKEASPVLPSRQAKVRWCSWLSRQSNTLKVSSSNLDEIIFFASRFSRIDFLPMPALWVDMGMCGVGSQVPASPHDNFTTSPDFTAPPLTVDAKGLRFHSPIVGSRGGAGWLPDHCPAIRTRGAFFVVIFVDINTMNVFVESIAVEARPDSTGVRHLDTWLGNCRPFFGGLLVLGLSC